MSKKKLLIILLAVLIVALIVMVVIIRNNITDSLSSIPVSTPRVFNIYDIETGMTEQDVKNICGWPDNESTYKSEYGIDTTYTYEKPSGKLIIVQFENGKVTSVGEY